MCTLPHLRIILFFIRVVFFEAPISRVAFSFCYALVPDTLALDFPTLVIDVWVFCLTVCDHIICVSRMENQEGHWGYC